MGKYVQITIPVTSGNRYFIANEVFCYLGTVRKNIAACACRGQADFYQIRDKGINYDIPSKNSVIIEQEECDPNVMPLQVRLEHLGDVPHTMDNGVKVTHWQETRNNQNPDEIALRANIVYF
jgi:hypothetical protein